MAFPALKPEDEWLDPSVDDGEPEGAVLRVVELADGSVEERALPLTLELLLHPREGDKVTQSDFHNTLLTSLLGRLRRWLERTPGVAVFSDFLFRWDKLGVPDSGPDVAVVRGLEGTREEISERVGGSFDVAAFGTRPELVIEVVSPEHGRLRSKDLKENLEYYARARVEEYLIVNPVRLGSAKPLQLLGYRLGGGREYTKIAADEEGRILSETTGLYFWSDPAGRRIEIFDKETGQRLLTSAEEADRADQESAARESAEARAAAAEEELARLRAELRRQGS